MSQWPAGSAGSSSRSGRSCSRATGRGASRPRSRRPSCRASSGSSDARGCREPPSPSRRRSPANGGSSARSRDTRNRHRPLRNSARLEAACISGRRAPTRCPRRAARPLRGRTGRGADRSHADRRRRADGACRPRVAPAPAGLLAPGSPPFVLGIRSAIARPMTTRTADRSTPDGGGGRVAIGRGARVEPNGKSAGSRPSVEGSVARSIVPVVTRLRAAVLMAILAGVLASAYCVIGVAAALRLPRRRVRHDHRARDGDEHAARHRVSRDLPHVVRPRDAPQPPRERRGWVAFRRLHEQVVQRRHATCDFDLVSSTRLRRWRVPARRRSEYRRCFVRNT